MVPELWRIGAGAMTRQQHVRVAEHLGTVAPHCDGYVAHDVPDLGTLLAITAAHHGRAALQCERCGGSGSTPRPGSRYAGANIRCPACGGVGWGTE